MAISAEDKNFLVSLYVGYFNRAPDPAGLQFWIDQVEAGRDTNTIAADFAASPEAKSLYPFLTTPDVSSPTSFITAVYANLFNRAPDAAGQAFWEAQLSSGAVSPADAIDAIIKGATTAPDSTILANKNVVGLDFATDAGNTPGFTFDLGGASGSAAKDAISGVTEDSATVTAAQAATDAYLSGVAIPGQTFTLTTGVDNFTGTANADLFSGANGTTDTLSTPDFLDGGAGTDQLNIVLDTGGSVPPATIKNIENIFVRNETGAAQTVNFALIEGEQQAWNDRSSGALTFNNLATGTTLGIKGDGQNNVGTTTFAMATASDAVSIAIDGGVKGGSAITNTAGTATSATIASSGAANTVGTIDLAGGNTVTATTINAAADLTATSVVGHAADAKVTISGAASKVAIGNLDANVDEVDASGLTAGGVTLVMDAETNTKVTGGAGDDSITTGAVLATGSVDAGAGTGDKLTVVNSTHLATSTLGGKYTNFEVLQLNDGVSVDLDNIAGITSVILDDNGAGVAATDLSATQAGDVTVADTLGGAITIGVKNATTSGQIDTVSISATTQEGTTPVANDIALGTATLTGVEKLEITGNSTTTGATAAVSKTGTVTFDTANATSLDSITLTNGGANDTNAANNNSITVASGHTATNLSINASATTGDTTINASAYNTLTGTNIQGGSGNDVISGSARSDVIVGGAGDDTITADAPTVTTTPAVPATQTFTVANAEAGDVISFAGQTYTWTAGAGDDAAVQALLGNAYTNESAVAAGTGVTATGGSWVVTGPTDGSALTQAAATPPAATNKPGASDSVVLTLSGATFDAGEFINTTINGGGVISANVGGQTLAAATTTLATALNTQVGITAVANTVAGTVTVTGPVGTDLALVSNVETSAAQTPDGDTETAATAAIPRVVTVTPDAGFNSGSISFTIGTSVFSAAFDTSIAQTVTNFVTANKAAIDSLTGAVLADAAGAFTLTKADGTAFNGGNLSITYPGDTDTDGAGADTVADPAGDIVVTNAGTPATTVVDNGVAIADANSADAAGATTTQTATISAATNGTAAVTSGGTAADTITGGEGKDLFIFTAGGSTAAATDTITDLNLGTNAAAGAVDTIQFADGAVTAGTFVSTLTAATDTAIAAATTLTQAANAVFTQLGNDEFAQFTFDSKTYLAADGTFNDYVVEITGVTGTLDGSDVSFIV